MDSDASNAKSHSAGSGMAMKAAVIAVLAIAVAAALYMKCQKTAPVAAQGALAIVKQDASKAALPRLLDLGADKCIPCKMMAPILEELKKEFAGIFDVEFVDVWKNPQEAEKHGVKIIPTQIFFDPSGKELFRHQGFFSKEDILAKWKDFGVEARAR